MYTRAEAAEMVRAYLHREYPRMDLVLLEDQAQEFEFGWVFFYNSKEYVETRDFHHALAGNAPLIVERVSGRILSTGTAEPVDAYIGAYRRTGDPHARPSSIVRITGYRAGANTVAAIQALRRHATKGLTAAKHDIERVLDGAIVEVDTGSVETAGRLVGEFDACGFNSSHERNRNAA